MITDHQVKAGLEDRPIKEMLMEAIDEGAGFKLLVMAGRRDRDAIMGSMN